MNGDFYAVSPGQVTITATYTNYDGSKSTGTCLMSVLKVYSETDFKWSGNLPNGIVGISLIKAENKDNINGGPHSGDKCLMFFSDETRWTWGSSMNTPDNGGWLSIQRAKAFDASAAENTGSTRTGHYFDVFTSLQSNGIFRVGGFTSSKRCYYWSRAEKDASGKYRLKELQLSN